MNPTNRKDPEGPDGEQVVAQLLRLAGARPAAPADAESRVRAAVHAEWRGGFAARRQRRRILWITGALAAAAAVVVFVGVRRAGPGPSEGLRIATVTRVVGSLKGLAVGSPIQEGMEIETGPTDRAAFLLSDGTALRIDHETRLRLLPGPALELSRGAVYVETGPRANGSGTLEIRTSLGTVRDIGTRFEVRLRDEAMQVSVREGLARLDRDGGTHEAGVGSQLIAEKDGAVTTRATPIHGPQWDWILLVAPAFEIEGHDLGEFLDWVARENGWRVQFVDPAIAARAATTVLHGSVQGLRPDEAPGAVLPTCGLRHRIEGDTMLIEVAENP
jgi:ferric-dicitrate binding protein FerR (iron transport regulator)